MSGQITVIDGVKYREVSRKANVGERVKVVHATQERYPIGAIGTCTRNDEFDDGSIDTTLSFPGSVKDGFINTCYATYVVLEPVESADDLRVQLDGLTQTVASLTLRVTELERSQSGKLTPQVIDDFVRKVRESSVQVPPAPREKTRDEIVEMAKKDVAELVARYTGTRSEVRFVVNREKRTVVALRYYCGEVDNRGKSRCAPDDCFNVHIGRAIALRRALGLTVPTEYYEAPQPESVRVGDVVTWQLSDPDSGKVLYRVDKVGGNSANCTSVYCASDFGGGRSGTAAYGGNFKWARIVDDSREEVSA